MAALIDGLRLIDEKARESGRQINEHAWDALVGYVQSKGEQIAIASGLSHRSATIAAIKARRERDNSNLTDAVLSLHAEIARE